MNPLVLFDMALSMPRSLDFGATYGAKVGRVQRAADSFARYGYRLLIQSYSDQFYAKIQQDLVPAFQSFVTQFQLALSQLTQLEFEQSTAQVSRIYCKGALVVLQCMFL